MKNISLSIIFFSVAFIALNANAQEITLGQMIDQATYTWDLEEKELETYEGLMEFCRNEDYRKSKIELLNEIHHLDSVLYKRALIASKRSKDKNIDHLIREIESFESEYNMRSMIKFLKDECKAQKELEKHSADLKTEFGSESYDGQIYLIEVELQNYVSHTTKRIDHIRKYVHKLNIK